MNTLQWKVCGMRSPENISELVMVKPNYIGFIFYEKSARFVSLEQNVTAILAISEDIKKVGVFVNASIEYLKVCVDTYQLDFVQLHGGETTDYCNEVKDLGIRIIKVFSIEQELDQEFIRNYEGLSEFFLFDTKTPKYGGSGEKFNWQILQNYSLETPYLLSGGIELEDIKNMDLMSFPGLIGIDVNSKFEISPALKKIEDIVELKKIINSKNN